MIKYTITYKKSLKICSLILLCSISSLAQEKNISEVLAPLHKANFDVNYGTQLNFLLNENQNIPIVDKLEFRTETDESTLSRQEYLFRSSFNSFKSRRVQKEITSNSVTYYQLRDQLLAEDHLANQYEEVVDWYYKNKELSILTEELIIVKDRLIVTKKKVSTSAEIDLVNILKLEKDIIDLEREMFRLKKEIQQSESLILAQSGSKEVSNLIADNWITIDKMYEEISLQTGASIPSTEEQLQTNRIEEAELAYSFENAERKKIFDFVQVKYAGRETDLIKKEISFGAGINIPTRSSERKRMNEKQIDIFDEEFKQRLLQHEIDQENKSLITAFNNIYEEYQLVNQQEEKQGLQATLDAYKRSGLALPMSLLKLGESILEYKKERFELEKEACSIYIESLITQGKINILSDVNYLSNNLDKF